MEEGIVYVALIKHPFSRDSSVTQDVSKRLKDFPDTSMKQLIDYALKYNSDQFSEQEKSVSEAVKASMKEVTDYETLGSSADPRKKIVLGIKALKEREDPNAAVEYRIFNSGYRVEQGLTRGLFILSTENVLGGDPRYFEDRVFRQNNTPYKCLELEVYTQPVGAGGLVSKLK